jgi:hypothetical protein
MSRPVRFIEDCVPSSETLDYSLRHTGLTTTDPDQGDRAFALVRVTGIGTSRWNTADGQRPTQAYIDSLQHPTQVNGQWPVTPSIYTPYTLQVVRVLRGSIPGAAITGFLEGGNLGGDSIQGCQPAAGHYENAMTPLVGHIYMLSFWRELTEEGLGAKPLEQPVIDQVYAYDPATDIVQTFVGPTKLSDAMKGLPPG